MFKAFVSMGVYHTNKSYNHLMSIWKYYLDNHFPKLIETKTAKNRTQWRTVGKDTLISGPSITSPT